MISATRRVLVRAIHRAERDGLVARNVAQLADCPQGTRRVSRSMTQDQARKVLASDLSEPPSGTSAAFWRAYFTLALYLGLRPAELTGLRCEDMDLSEGVIRVRKSLKRGEGGLAPEALKTHRASGRWPCPRRCARCSPRCGKSGRPTGCGSARPTPTGTAWCSAMMPGGP